MSCWEQNSYMFLNQYQLCAQSERDLWSLVRNETLGESGAQILRSKVVIGVFKHAESKSGLYFVLTLLLHRFLATFGSKHMTFFAGFP